MGPISRALYGESIDPDGAVQLLIGWIKKYVLILRSTLSHIDLKCHEQKATNSTARAPPISGVKRCLGNNRRQLRKIQRLCSECGRSCTAPATVALRMTVIFSREMTCAVCGYKSTISSLSCCWKSTKFIKRLWFLGARGFASQLPRCARWRRSEHHWQPTQVTWNCAVGNC
jgi:hypothetical protein